MRIAIYSRKSKWTGRGDSVENQIAMCREYIEKYIEGSETAEIFVYEDEGFSGKNTKRPQFQKMLRDMKLRPFQYLVCYRLDRLGRNVSDLAQLIEKLNQEHTEFISIRERFDTTTPMGKAMLYFSGVLAQMEREQIAERVRDNMLMLAKSGRWLGGNTPLGFSVEEQTVEEAEGKTRKVYYLTVEEEEIKIPILMFQEFLRCRSLTKTAEYLSKRGIYTRKGKEYSPAAIRDILTNPVYCTVDELSCAYFEAMGCQMYAEPLKNKEMTGFLSYGKTISTRYKGEDTGQEQWILARGKHRGILTGKDYVKVQKLLEENKTNSMNKKQVRNEVCLLSGILFCSCGHKMVPKYYSAEQKQANGERRFSYRCSCRDKTRGKQCSNASVQGNSLDAALWEAVLHMTEDKVSLYDIFLRVKTKLQNHGSEMTEKAQVIQQEIREKKEEIRRLTRMIAGWKRETTLKPVEEELKRRLEELEQLRKEEIENRETQGENSGKHAELWEQLDTFEHIGSMLCIREKREYMQICITSAVWDGAELFVK